MLKATWVLWATVKEGFHIFSVFCFPLALLNLGPRTITSAQMIRVLNLPRPGVWELSFLVVSSDMEENQRHLPFCRWKWRPCLWHPQTCWRDGIFYFIFTDRHRTWKIFCRRTPEIISQLNGLKHCCFSTVKLFLTCRRGGPLRLLCPRQRGATKLFS